MLACLKSAGYVRYQATMDLFRCRCKHHIQITDTEAIYPYSSIRLRRQHRCRHWDLQFDRLNIRSMVFQHQLLPGATRSPETKRPRQDPPTQQPSRSPAKKQASQPKSASDVFSKLPFQRRQLVTTFYVGSTVERSIFGEQSAV